MSFLLHEFPLPTYSSILTDKLTCARSCVLILCISIWWFLQMPLEGTHSFTRYRIHRTKCVCVCTYCLCAIIRISTCSSSRSVQLFYIVAANFNLTKNSLHIHIVIVANKSNEANNVQRTTTAQCTQYIWALNGISVGNFRMERRLCTV